MIINNNYAQQVAAISSNTASVVNSDNSTSAIQAIPGEKDTVTFSDKALAMMNGNELNQQAITYVKPVTTRVVQTESKTEGALDESNTNKNVVIDNRFSEMMQSILDKRLGIDRDKLKELEAMMEEIANNENMSPEEKRVALEKLAEMREKIIAQSIEVREIAKQIDDSSAPTD